MKTRGLQRTINHPQQPQQKPTEGELMMKNNRRTVLAVSALALLASACGSSTKTAATTVAPGAATTAAPAAAVTTAAPAAATTAAAGAAMGGNVKGAPFDKALHDMLPAEIQKAGFMTFATDPTDPPLEFKDDANKLVGAEVDLAAALGSVLGVEIKLVESKFDAIIPGIEAGRFDGSVSGFADRTKRQAIVDFVDNFTTSRGYLRQTGKFPELNDAKDLCGRIVAVAKGTSIADNVPKLSEECVAAGKKAIDAQVFPDQGACVLAVQSGRADLTVLSAHAALWIAKNSSGALETVIRPTEGNDVNGIVLKKKVLAEPFMKAMQGLMDSGTFKEIFGKWGLEKVILTKATLNAGTN
jgi:polar amino acid transport system substrate-binding protein